MKQTDLQLDYKITICAIIDFANRYRDDWRTALSFDSSASSPLGYYEYVKNLPFISDGFDEKGQPWERVARPKFTLNPSWSLHRDCDDKTTCIGAYAVAHQIPWRICVVGEKDSPHHVYPELKFKQTWIPFDATFPERSEIGKRIYKENFRQIFNPT